MIDDKAIEAALDAYYSALEWRKKPETYMHDMRAAIAAADKVRAEGEFDFAWCDETTFEFARRAFAAGLAKGEATLAEERATREIERALNDDQLAEAERIIGVRDEEIAKNEADRAALRRLILGIRDDVLSGYERDAIASKIDAALALVRKGE